MLAMSVNGNSDTLTLAIEKQTGEDLEGQHRRLLEDYGLPSIPVIEPDAGSDRVVVLRTVTTYGAYEDPI